MKRVILAVGVTVLVLGSTACKNILHLAPLPPAVKPAAVDRGILFFTSFTSSSIYAQIHHMDPTAFTVTCLSDGTCDEWGLWSDDRQEVLFWTYGSGPSEIWTMSPTGAGRAPTLFGSEVFMVSNWPADAVSPIAMYVYSGGFNDIFITNRGRTVWTNLTNDSPSDYDPILSPDRSLIYFLSDRDGDHEVHRMNTDGTGIVNLTNDADQNYEFDLSPDGSRIVYTTYGATGVVDVWVMNSDGSGRTNLTNGTGFDYCQMPSWSPDGSRIVYEHQATGSSSDILVRSWDGSGLLNLSNSPGYYESSPVWSPDGTRVAFTSEMAGDGYSDIYVVNADGTHLQRATTMLAYCYISGW
jgi:TolB protein